MTRPGWMAEAALGAVLAPGTTVVVADPMDLPLVALRPDLQIVTPSGMPVLRPGSDGVAVIRTVPGDATDASGPVLAAGPTVAAADALARACLGRAPDGCFDGTRLSAEGDVARSWGQWLDAARGHDPLALLDRAAGSAPGIFGIGVTTGGDALVWVDPLCCLRPVSLHDACRDAVDRGSSSAPIRLPYGGRGRVRLMFAGPAPALSLPDAGEVARIDERTLEIGPAGAEGRAWPIPVRGPRSRIVRIGAVLAFPGDPAAAEFDDPLEIYADPAFSGGR